jgi:apolipoprotein D and lipocalin family protein
MHPFMKTHFFLVLVLVLVLISCKTIPKGATAVKPFNQEKYLGTWYEIARLDYKYERHLDHVTAEYGLKPNGLISVTNKGFNNKKQKWEESTGKAKPVSDAQEANLKVSFFGPFYSGYNVIAIDDDYKYALVAGKNTDYLWLLSRKTTMPEDVKLNFLKKAQAIGYNTDQLVWVKQD